MSGDKTLGTKLPLCLLRQPNNLIPAIPPFLSYYLLTTLRFYTSFLHLPSFHSPIFLSSHLSSLLIYLPVMFSSIVAFHPSHPPFIHPIHLSFIHPIYLSFIHPIYLPFNHPILFLPFHPFIYSSIHSSFLSSIHPSIHLSSLSSILSPFLPSILSPSHPSFAPNLLSISFLVPGTNRTMLPGSTYVT